MAVRHQHPAQPLCIPLGPGDEFRRVPVNELHDSHRPVITVRHELSLNPDSKASIYRADDR